LESKNREPEKRHIYRKEFPEATKIIKKGNLTVFCELQGKM